MNVNIRKAYNGLLAKSLRPEIVVESDHGALVVAADFLVKHLMDETLPPILKKRKVKLREDAQYLLFLLLKEMIVVPILSAKVRNVTQTIEALQSDLTLIISSATVDQSNEISGHSVLQAIETNWSKLKLSVFGIWH